jgi:ATP-binding cassette subfamily F protein uup
LAILIGLEHVSQEWPGKQVLNDVTLGIDAGERIGIVGRNGDGKSTLLDLISGTITPDSGNIIPRNNLTIGYLGQHDQLDDEDSVAHAVVGDRPEYEWASDPKIRSILDELLVGVDWHAKVKELSGGQRRRCDLARVLVGDWDVILMDEPTNHLDMHAITWLTNHLKHRWPEGTGALLVVTHDRWFLDEICEHMWEVHDGTIEPFEGGYSAYIQQREERARLAQSAETRRQNILRKELNWLAHGAKARSSKPKFRIKEAQALIANDPPLRNSVELKRMAVSRLGKLVITMEKVGFSYGDKSVLKDISWLIGPGERYGILGENGVGKSTLLSVMTGRLRPTSGYIKIGKSVRFGILTQNLDDLHTKDDWRVSEVLSTYKKYYAVDGKEQTPEQLLERLGFERKELSTYIKDLSGGQQRRLALLCVLMSEPNVLVLDEPGNDLDTDMLAVLEDLLDTWPGTLLMVTHDRYLMERVTDDQFALIDGHIRHVPGGVDEYLKMLDAQPQDTSGVSKRAASDANGGGQSKSATMSNQERRELKKRFDATDRKLKRLQEEPDKICEKMKSVDPSDYEGLEKCQNELNEVNQQISDLEDVWLELSDELDLE